mmetsp:Transcript_30698/g.79628  ORF Transcript_30698/g.79628 Transcript_30698/m.79628 type:complete len:525 (-) Transcript_30698:148-1722(-)
MEMSSLDGQICYGSVKSFRDNWGFLVSDQFTSDLFFHLRDNPSLTSRPISGMPVTFTVDASGSKPKAVNVVSASDDFAEPAAAPRPKPGNLLMADGAISGVVRSFKGDWGFLTSDAFEGDCFFHLRDNPQAQGIVAGTTVTFALSVSNSGKRQATNMTVVKKEPIDLIGQTASGTVRSFSNSHGFIISPVFNGDLFVGLIGNPHLRGQQLVTGESVDFTISADKNGRPEASNVQRVGGPVPVPSVPAPWQPAPPAGLLRDRSRTPRGHPAAGAGPGELVGIVKRFDSGWGFLLSDSIPGDIFVHERDNPTVQQTGLDPGMQVAFTLAEDKGGKRKAVGVTPLGRGMRAPPPPLYGRSSYTQPRPLAAPAPPGPPAAAQGVLPSHRMVGRVKRFRDGWGFLDCDQVDGDIFVGKKDNPNLPDLVEGQHVSFILQLQANGKRKAGEAEVSIPPASELAGTGRYRGTVRSFRGSWGLIVSESFAGDLFFGEKGNPGLGPVEKDMALEFDIVIGSKGKAEAMNVTRAY